MVDLPRKKIVREGGEGDPHEWHRSSNEITPADFQGIEEGNRWSSAWDMRMTAKNNNEGSFRSFFQEHESESSILLKFILPNEEENM